uniref:Ribosome biogenesis protein NOP53 n=1 Tax=Strongyloides stercoralis TaxID=6248 RepID=A0A0K0EQW3_STRER
MAKTVKKRLSAPESVIETPLRGVKKANLKKNLKRRQSCGAVLKSTGHNSFTTPADKTLNDSKLSLLNVSISPHSLTHKLQEFGKEYLKKGDIKNIPDATGISEQDLSFSIEEFENKRKECLSKYLSDAALAGAKCLLTETIATRSVTKKICEETGATEEQILFDHNNYISENKWTAEVDRKIKDNIFETLSDLKSQISFKSSILENIKTPDSVKRNLRISSVGRRINEEVMRTPVNNGHINPLSHTKIQEDYAARVASDLRHRRVIKKNAVTTFFP